MEQNKRPNYKNGKICYVEIPSLDPEQSSSFYNKCFGWNIRNDNHGNLSFDDTVGEVSGMWVKGRPASSSAGILISIMVKNIEASLELVKANGGKIVQPPDMDASELTAWFTDPTGNIFGLYQEHQL